MCRNEKITHLLTRNWNEKETNFTSLVYVPCWTSCNKVTWVVLFDEHCYMVCYGHSRSLKVISTDQQSVHSFLLVVTINCDNFVRLSGARRKTQQRRWSRPLSLVAWTTVMRCAMALTKWRAACSQFRTLLPGLWRAPGDVILSGLYSASCTGFLCGSVSCSKLRLSSTSPCLATPQVTWPTTVSSSPTPVSTLEHSLSVGCAAVLETRPLPPQDQKSGTVCRPIADYVGCHTASSGRYWRHFYSDSEAKAKCELFLIAPNKNILTYLLI